MKQFLVGAMICAILLSPLKAFAGKSRSSSRSSRSSSRSISKPSRGKAPQSKSWGTKRQPAKKSWSNKAPVNANANRTSAKTVKTDPAAARRHQLAKEKGTHFKSKSEAQTAFKQKYADKYTSKYASEPSTRPTHIPRRYSYNGTQVNVTYNSAYGGYGHMGPSGWIAYDAFADGVMLGTLMNSNHYAYGPAPVVQRPVANFWSFMQSLLFWLFLVVIFLIALRILVGNQKLGRSGGGSGFLEDFDFGGDDY